MSKEEFVEENGYTDACLCENCGHYFLLNKAVNVREPHGELTPTCPYCGSDYLSYPDEVDMRKENDDE